MGGCRGRCIGIVGRVGGDHRLSRLVLVSKNGRVSGEVGVEKGVVMGVRDELWLVRLVLSRWDIAEFG